MTADWPDDPMRNLVGVRPAHPRERDQLADDRDTGSFLDDQPTRAEAAADAAQDRWDR